MSWPQIIRVTVCCFLCRHATMLTCQCYAYYGLFTAMEINILYGFVSYGLNDTDYKSTHRFAVASSRRDSKATLLRLHTHTYVNTNLCTVGIQIPVT